MCRIQVLTIRIHNIYSHVFISVLSPEVHVYERWTVAHETKNVTLPRCKPTWISLEPIEHGFNGAALPDFINILGINGSNSNRGTSHFVGVVTVKKNVSYVVFHNVSLREKSSRDVVITWFGFKAWRYSRVLGACPLPWRPPCYSAMFLHSPRIEETKHWLQRGPLTDLAPIVDSRTCLEEEGEQRGIQLVESKSESFQTHFSRHSCFLGESSRVRWQLWRRPSNLSLLGPRWWQDIRVCPRMEG